MELGRSTLLGSADQTPESGYGPAFSATTSETLAADLRTILAPDYATRARDLAARMTKPAESIETTADLLEEAARRKTLG